VTHRTAGGGSAGMAGNVILGGLIGAVVDSNNGATQDLVPNPLTVTLELQAVAPAPAAAETTTPPTS
jgi:chorismate mutase